MGKLSGRWVFLAFSHCLCLSLFRCSLLTCSEAPTSAPQPQQDFGIVPAQNKAEGGTSKPPDKAPVSKERRSGRTPTQETLRIIRGGGSRASDPPTQLKTHPPRPPPHCKIALINEAWQWILHNLKSTQLPPDYDKNSMIENYIIKIKTHRRAHRFAPPPPLKYLPLQFFTDLVSYLVEDVLHVLSALERPNAVDEAAVLKL